jgi:regulator of protease activity HflC (stomatin/prohibitin superfamily)
MNALPPGRYNVHYIDKQNRVALIPRTGETTYDGFKVALELLITYRVIDPIKALEVQQAVETLLRFIQSDLKEFIRSHKYDELIGDSDGNKIDNNQFALYIKEQHAGRYPLSKLFLIADVVIKEKVGDPKMTELREKQQINQRQFAAQKEIQRHNQELEKKVAEQEATIKQVRVEADAKLQETIRKLDLQKIDLENARAEFQFRQEKWMRAMDAIGLAFSSPAFSRDPQVVEIIWQLLSAMGVSRQRLQEAVASTEEPVQEAAAGTEDPLREPVGTSNPEEMDSLTNMLLGLLARKRF